MDERPADGREPVADYRDAFVRHEVEPVAANLETLILEDLRANYPDLPDGLTVHFDTEWLT